jgi:hypothetical protein
MSSAPVLSPNQPLIQRASGALSGSKVAEVWSWPHTSNYCRWQEYMNLYICPVIRLREVVFDYFSTGTIYLMPALTQLPEGSPISERSRVVAQSTWDTLVLQDGGWARDWLPLHEKHILIPNPLRKTRKGRKNGKRYQLRNKDYELGSWNVRTLYKHMESIFHYHQSWWMMG